MAVVIRLARFGRNKVPFYHIVATDSRNRRDSKHLEKLGTFNPLLEDSNKEKIKTNNERIEYWLSVGAKPSDRVAILLIKAGVKNAEKYKPKFTPQQKGYGSKKKGAKTEASTPAVSPTTTPSETPSEAPKQE